MKFVTFLMSLLITFNLQASTGLAQDFKEITDDYEYWVSVEWDQQSKEEFEFKNEEFSKKLDQLIKRGLTSNHIKKSFQEKSSFIPNGLSGSQLIEWFRTNSNKFYNQGASWDGTAVVVYGGVAAIFIGFIAYSVWSSNNYTCSQWIPTGPQNSCKEWIRK